MDAQRGPFDDIKRAIDWWRFNRGWLYEICTNHRQRAAKQRKQKNAINGRAYQ